MGYKFTVNAKQITLTNKEGEKQVLQQGYNGDTDNFPTEINTLRALGQNGLSQKVKDKDTGKIIDRVHYSSSIAWEGKEPTNERQSARPNIITKRLEPTKSQFADMKKNELLIWVTDNKLDMPEKSEKLKKKEILEIIYKQLGL